MSQKLTDYLKSLANDPQKVERLKSNPDAEMDAAGLSQEEKDAIKTGDAGRIRNLAGAGAADAVTVLVAVIP